MSDKEDTSRSGQELTAAAPHAMFIIQPPESFDFTKPHEWDKWIQRFKRFQNCNYRVLQDELIRDRLIVGLLDKGFECMQLAKPRLNKAVRMACQREELKKQHASL